MNATLRTKTDIKLKAPSGMNIDFSFIKGADMMSVIDTLLEFSLQGDKEIKKKVMDDVMNAFVNQS